MDDRVSKYFNLAEDPFTISPNPRYLFLADQHKEALANCQYTIESRAGLAVIYGDIGTGKTTISRHLYEKYKDNEKYQIALTVTPDLKTDVAFLRSIMAEYGLQPKRSHAANIAAFRAFAAKAYREGKNLVLLVDEAQQMTPAMLEVVRIFLNFETNKEKFIQVVLFGQNELATMIDAKPMRPIKSRVSVFGALTSMSQGTIDKMISFRWKAAGGDEHPFTPDAIEAVYQHSRGLPRDVIRLCHYGLVRTFLSQKDKVHRTMIDAAMRELRMDKEEE